VRDSDATLVLTLGMLQGGTLLTTDFAQRMSRPCRIVDMRATPLPGDGTLAWLWTHRPKRLNIAGLRASQGDAVYARGLRFCQALLSQDLLLG